MGKKHKKHHKSDKLERQPGEEERQTPLKIVLKVGGTPSTSIPEPVIDNVTSDYSEERRHKHKKKKKKKSAEKEKHRHREHGDSKHDKHKKDRKRTHDAMEENEPPSIPVPVASATLEVAAPAIKRVLVMEPDPFETSRTLRERQAEYGTSQLQACLEYIHKQLHRKDVNGFFGFPVTDNIAPGYSSIIHQPMDFSTMKSKIENHEYSTVLEYKKDFKLMCDNCTTYNRPETVYYKEAKRLLSIGYKMMSKEKLLLMKKNLSFMATISNEELGIDDDDVNLMLGGGMTEPAPRATPKSKPKPKPKPSKFEAIPDNLTPEEILAAAKEAAKEAADELTLRRPRSKIGFLRRRPDGTTTLNIINPDNDGIVSEKERIVNLGQLTGKLPSGVGSIAGFKEDKRNKANPVNYVNYGPYSSFAPCYDSSFANLTKEDTDLLLATYGDDTSLQYALSLKSFVENAGDYTNLMVDSLLNVITGSEHSKANKLLEQRKKEAEDLVRLAEEQRAAEASGQMPPTPSDIDYDALRTLSDELGVDMSFLEVFERNQRPAPKTEDERRIDAKLKETSVLLRDLQRTQNERLSRKPPPHLSNISKPSEKETKLAERVTVELTQLAQQAAPSDITSVAALRQAMGVALVPSEGAADHEEQLEPRTEDQQQQQPQQQQQGEEASEPALAPGTASQEKMEVEEEEEDDEEEEEDDEEEEGVTEMVREISQSPSEDQILAQLRQSSGVCPPPPPPPPPPGNFLPPATTITNTTTAVNPVPIPDIKTEPSVSIKMEKGVTACAAGMLHHQQHQHQQPVSMPPPSAVMMSHTMDDSGLVSMTSGMCVEQDPDPDPDIEQDLAELLETTPLMNVCGSPSLGHSGGLDPADLM